MSVQNYSKTPSSNVVVNDGSDAVSTAEGMARSSVNDAIRAMMADIAKYALDHGSLITSGTGAAYLLNTNSQITTLTNGVTLTAKAHIASNADATLNVNSLGARPLKLRGSGGLITAPAGAIKAGDILSLTYWDNSWVCSGIADYASVVDGLVTAASILTKIKTVDGAGSGLDADLLDGAEASWFADIPARLGYTPVQQGGGVGQGGSKVRIGWGVAGNLHLQVNNTNFADTWPIHIGGNAASANYATNAGNADTVDGWHAASFASPNSRRVDAGGVAMTGAVGWRYGPAGTFVAGLYTSPINGVAAHHAINHIHFYYLQIQRADGAWITMAG